MSFQPTKLERTAAGLRIAWSDGQQREYTTADLRAQCPCATCREERNAPPSPPDALAVISAAEAQPLAIVAMRPVGSYAYSIAFSDGHDTGIYTFERLRSLGEAIQ